MSLLSDLKKELPKESKAVIARFLESPCCGEDQSAGGYKLNSKPKRGNENG